MEEEHIENKTEELDLSYKGSKEVAKSGILGFFIGLAIIVPGVSGSAVAIIFKLYEKLLYAVSNIFKRLKVCILFLLPILIGAILGFVLGFFGVKELLNILPFATPALFAGLMLGAYPAVTAEIKNEKPTPFRIVLFVLGLLIPIAFSALSVFLNEEGGSLENLPWYQYLLFLVLGYLMALTQLIPGLSATALLMMFGYFSPIMESVSLTYWGENPMVFLVYAMLAIGFLLGLFTMSKAITWLIAKFRVPTFFTISGLSLGSFLCMFFNPEIMETYKEMDFSNVLSAVDLGLGIALFVLGLIGAYLLVRYESKHQKKA